MPPTSQPNRQLFQEAGEDRQDRCRRKGKSDRQRIGEREAEDGQGEIRLDEAHQHLAALGQEA